MTSNPFTLTKYAPGVYLIPYQVLSINVVVDTGCENGGQYTMRYAIEIRVSGGEYTDTIYLATKYNTVEEAAVEVERMAKLHESIMTPLEPTYVNLMNKIASIMRGSSLN